MEQAAEILVIILSVVLAIFLIVGIALLILLIKLTKTIKQVVEKAEGVITDVGAAAHSFKNVAGPLSIGKLLINLAGTVLSGKKKRR